MAKNRETSDRERSARSGVNAPANVGDQGRLVTLHDADFEVADGFPDPRGWEVRAGGKDGQKVGKVDELLIDPAEQRVRYLVVKLDDDISHAKDRKVLIPVGVATLDDDDDRVLVPNKTPEFFAGLPEYDPERFSREHEDRVREHVVGAPLPAQGTARDYYAGEQYDENRLFRARGAEGEREARIPLVEEEIAVGKRRVQAGEVDVRKTVETEHVKREVPLAHEEVEIERRPVEGAPAAPADLQDREIRVPVMAEEAVVEKRPVVKEEYVIRKRIVRDTKPVEADIRRERVDVQRQGDAKIEAGERERLEEERRRAR